MKTGSLSDSVANFKDATLSLTISKSYCSLICHGYLIPMGCLPFSEKKKKKERISEERDQERGTRGKEGKEGRESAIGM